MAAALGALCALSLTACTGEPPPPNAPQGPDAKQQVERGRLLLAQYQCGSCHAIPGVEASRGTLASDLDAFGRRSYIAGVIPNEPGTLARWIVQPQSLVPGTPMPAMGVSPADARLMAAYLHSLQ